MWQLTDGAVQNGKQMQEVFVDPAIWNTFPGWDARRTVEFVLKENQFFPMGDNSPESLDERCWAGTKDQEPMQRGVNEPAWKWSDASYVPRDLLVGKALVVFWPHSWNSPIPFLPNFKEMNLIR